MRRTWAVRVYREGETLATWPDEDPYLCEYFLHSRTALAAECRAVHLAGALYRGDLVAVAAERVG